MCSKPASPEGALIHFDGSSSVAAELCDDWEEQLPQHAAGPSTCCVRLCLLLLAPPRDLPYVPAYCLLCMPAALWHKQRVSIQSASHHIKSLAAPHAQGCRPAPRRAAHPPALPSPSAGSARRKMWWRRWRRQPLRRCQGAGAPLALARRPCPTIRTSLPTRHLTLRSQVHTRCLACLE